MFGSGVSDVRVNALWVEYFLWEYFGLNKIDLKKLSNVEVLEKAWFCSCMERKKKQVRTELELRSKWR